MRILFLCGATFAVGLLAGSLLFEDSGATRVVVREGSGRGAGDRLREWDREQAAGRAEEAGERAAAPAKIGRNADVRTLSREAARNIERLKSSERTEAFLTGDGTIRGTVRDPGGLPVSGVTVTAIPQGAPAQVWLERRWARQRPHLDREFSKVAGEAIAGELWRRDVRRSATTDANGKYAIRGLSRNNHTLTAFHDEYEVKPLNQRGKLQPDAIVDFLAKPIHETRVEVLLPDTTLAEYARLAWEGPEGRGVEIWSRDRGTARLPLGSVKVQARIWLPEPMESDEVSHQVTADSSEPLVLQLVERQVLTATLVLPTGFSLPEKVIYRVRLLDGPEQLEPETLLTNASQAEARTPTPGRADFFDLEPGRYMVAAFLDKRRLLASATIDVGEESQEVDLKMEPPDPGSYVTVQLLGPDGGPIPGQVSFRIMAGGKRPRLVTTSALAAGDAWLVFVDAFDSKESSDASLRVGTRDYGGAVESISLRGRQTITIRFDKPAKLSVRIEDYKGSAVEGSLYVALRGAIGADAFQKVGPDGKCELRGVQPGSYRLNLYLRRKGKNWPISQRLINLRGGDDSVKLPVPILHTLKVRWVGKGKPRKATLRGRDEMIGDLRREARLAGRVATFRNLAAGTYTVECARKRATVRVPGTPLVSLK